MKNTISRITIKENNKYPLNQDFILALEEVLEHFSWMVVFGEEIEEICEDDEESNDIHNDFNKLLNGWIITFEEAMIEPEIDYSDWLEVFKSNLI